MPWSSLGMWPRQLFCPAALVMTAGPACGGHKEHMPVPSPYLIVLSSKEEAVLAARARSVRGEYRARLRARIVLAAAAGKNNAAIAVELGVCTDTIRKWRRRFAAGRLPGLKDAPRSGRPPVFTAADPAEAGASGSAVPAAAG